MILAKEFSRSAIARKSDFSTNAHERGVFVMKERRPKSNAGRDLEDNGERNELSGVTRLKPDDKLVRGALIAQFAASDPVHFADAAELIWPHVDGIDLNCGARLHSTLPRIVLIPVFLGCPQTWAYQEHIGSFLLRKPDTCVQS